MKRLLILLTICSLLSASALAGDYSKYGVDADVPGMCGKA